MMTASNTKSAKISSTAGRSKTAAATREKLIDAFWQLYEENSIEKISIGRLTKLAGCNRSTFYEYFVDIYDLLNQVEAQLIDEVKEALLTEFENDFPSSMEELHRKTLKVLGSRFERLFQLLGPKGDPQFAAKIKAAVFPIIFKLADYPYEKPVSEYIIAFIVSSYLGLISHWHEAGRDIPFEQLLPLAQALVAKGVFGYANLSPFDEK